MLLCKLNSIVNNLFDLFSSTNFISLFYPSSTVHFQVTYNIDKSKTINFITVAFYLFIYFEVIDVYKVFQQ